MTVDEFLTQNKSVLKTMVVNGISAELGRCAGMLEFYENEKAEHGCEYAIELCKERYCLHSRSQTFHILKSLKMDVVI